MTRTLIDIPKEKLRVLDEIASERDTSRAAVVRTAVDEFLSRQKRNVDAFGILRDAQIDGLKLQQDLRGEWDESSS